jgi:YD repeat-containing protein
MKRAASFRSVVAAGLAINMVATALALPTHMAPALAGSSPARLVAMATPAPVPLIKRMSPQEIRAAASVLNLNGRLPSGPKLAPFAAHITGVRVNGPAARQKPIQPSAAAPDPRAMSSQFRALHGIRYTEPTPAPISTLRPASPSRTIPAPPSLPVARTPSIVPQATRRRLTVSASSPSYTGINDYWTYEEGPIAGVGKYMANVGTGGNLVVQADDMAIPHKGIALAFRRTYNSLSQHDYFGTDGSQASNYGAGWTNTFDAHLAFNSGNQYGQGLSVFDIDGTRYDYMPDGQGNWIAPAGQYAILTCDGTPPYDCGNGYFWTKKNGTVYYFWAPNLGPSYAGLQGRLFTIWGRNNNTALNFRFYFTNGDASCPCNLTDLYVTEEDGRSVHLTFSDVTINNQPQRLLSTLTRPDGIVVAYAYDASGNLSEVDEPPNNTSWNVCHGGMTQCLPQWYVYYAGGSMLYYAMDPRMVMYEQGYREGSTPGQGGLVAFAFDGTTHALNLIAWTGFMNLDPGDGTNTRVQPALTDNYTQYRTENVTWTGTTSTRQDTDGHLTAYTFDSAGRETGRNAWNGTQYLNASQIWDANNNLTSTIDPRGYETDYAYDTNGNAIAVALPSVSTSQGTFRPTSLYSYDRTRNANNIVQYCDPVKTHALGQDWTSNPGTSDSLCPNQSGATRYTWDYSDSIEPFGRLSNSYTPLGYHRAYAYNTGAQGGDFGLPTDVTMDSFLEADGSNISPHEQFEYDGYGNVSCFSKLQDGSGTHWWRLSYDSLSRETSVADPDDASLSLPQCPNSAGISGSHIVTATSYYLNGEVQSTQTPSEYAVGVSTAFAYDADGDENSETHHYNCIPGSCTTGTTTKWYDGAGRLVETELPQDPTYDAFTTPWLTRYIYDLSQGQTLTVGQEAGFRAYGNLYKTTEYFSNAWNDIRGNAYDALDRQASKFYYPPIYSGSHTMYATQLAYDGSSATYGLLSSSRDTLGTTTSFAYDQAGRLTQTSYSDGVTPTLSTIYDPDGRAASTTSSSYGTEQRLYDQDGRLQTDTEPQPAGYTSPSTLTYAYYPDNGRSSVSVISQSLTQANLESYSYRMDGLPEQLDDRYNGQTYTQRWTYDSAGRPGTMADTYNANAYVYSYNSSGQVSSWIVPSGSLTSVSHDAEGEAKSYLPSALGSTVTELYTTRGELAGQGGQPCNSPSNKPPVPPPNTYPPSLSKFANGIALPQNCTPYGTGEDLFAGAIVAPQQGYGNVRVEAVTEIFGFDNDGRQVSATKTADYANHGYIPQASYSKTYDAENHLSGEVLTTAIGSQVAPQTSSYSWGPNGHPIKAQSSCGSGCTSGTDSIHWDGDAPLFVTDSGGSLLQVFFSPSVFATPSNGFTIVDRDWAGIVVGTHTAQGPSGWYGGDSWATTQGNGWTNWSPENQPISTPHEDMVVIGPSTFQGVRTYNADAAQWTTPDAYAGELHDPMSQKSYMWNRNNPQDYSDPSGFVPMLITDPFAITANVVNVGNFLFGDDIKTVSSSSASPASRVFAGASLASWFLPGKIAELGVKSLFKIGESGLAHVAARHFVEGAAKASKFLAGTTKEDVTRMVQEAIEHGDVSASRENILVERDLGVSIGTVNGQPTSTIRAIFDTQGKLESAYPIPTRR